MPWEETLCAGSHRVRWRSRRPVQKTFRHLWCTEIAANGEKGFEDNGHYVGHDEPDIGFFSIKRGSANRMTDTTVLPVAFYPWYHLLRAPASMHSFCGGT